jgi:hypothetical protein
MGGRVPEQVAAAVDCARLAIDKYELLDCIVVKSNKKDQAAQATDQRLSKGCRTIARLALAHIFYSPTVTGSVAKPPTLRFHSFFQPLSLSLYFSSPHNF